MCKTVSFTAYSLTFLPKVWYVLQFMLIRRLWWIRFWGPVLDRKVVTLGSILVSPLTLPGRPLGSNFVPRGTQMASKSGLDDPMNSFWKTSAVIPWNWSPWHAFLDYIIISVEICSIRPLRCWILWDVCSHMLNMKGLMLTRAWGPKRQGVVLTISAYPAHIQ